MTKNSTLSTVIAKSYMRKVYDTYRTHFHRMRKLSGTFVVNEFPRGFPRLAALQSSSDDLYIFRGFKRVHARILLQLEVEISQLAKDLDKLDKEDDADPNMWYRLSNTEDDKDWDPRQRDLINELRGKINAYGM